MYISTCLKHSQNTMSQNKYLDIFIVRQIIQRGESSEFPTNATYSITSSWNNYSRKPT